MIRYIFLNISLVKYIILYLLIKLKFKFGFLGFSFFCYYVFIQIWLFINTPDAGFYKILNLIIDIYSFTYLVNFPVIIIPYLILSNFNVLIRRLTIKLINYLKLNFWELIIVLKMLLNEEIIRCFYIIYSIVLLLIFFLAVLYIFLLNKNKYLGVRDFKKLSFIFKFVKERQWRYSDRYWNRLFVIWYWFMFSYLVDRFTVKVFFLTILFVSYNYLNLDYWFINENIDFVLDIIHWYLTFLISLFIIILYHYLGFVYIILAFTIIMFIFCLYEVNNVNNLCFLDDVCGKSWAVNRWDFLNNTTFLFFMIIKVSIKNYFLFIDSMDSLVLFYCLLLLYLILLLILGFIFFKLLSVRFFFS